MDEPVGTPEEEDVSEAEVEQIGTLARMTGVFTSPRNIFEDLARKPSWIVPMLVVVLASLLSGFIMKPYIMTSERMEEQVEQIMERANMDEDKAEAILERNLTYGLPIQAIVFTPLLITVIAGVLLLVGNFVMGGEAKFKQLFSLITHTSLISIVQLVIMVPIIMARESIDNLYFSLAAFFPLDMKDAVVFKLINAVDVFAIWTSVLVAIGLAAIYKWEQKKANTLIISLWVIGLAIYGGVLAIF